MSVDPLVFILMLFVFLAIGILTYVLVARTIFKEYVPPTRAFFWDSIVESKYAQPKKMIADTARAYALFYCSMMFWLAVAFKILGVDFVPIILLCLGTSALYALIFSWFSHHYVMRVSTDDVSESGASVFIDRIYRICSIFGTVGQVTVLMLLIRLL